MSALAKRNWILMLLYLFITESIVSMILLVSWYLSLNNGIISLFHFHIVIDLKGLDVNIEQLKLDINAIVLVYHYESIASLKSRHRMKRKEDCIHTFEHLNETL